MQLPTTLTVLLAAVAPVVSAYPAKTALNCRTGPGTSYALVKTYAEGTDLKLTCQTTGPSINGDTLWDKTSDGCYVADYYVKTGTSGYVVGKCSTGGNLPGLNSVQSAHAKAIIAQAKKDAVGHHGCSAAIATALVESNILVYANRAVPSSLNYPYDAIGSDHDSVGIFQQRAMYYPNIAADMDPAGSAHQFLVKMVGISGWKTMAIGTLCQKVQVSAYPDRYAAQASKAESICSAGGL